ncbi:hypothetical protein RHMOL_Rhmol07G0292900 [Rhododendron molle]|uniref:Uncharacterized protein n=1 Tax=Rhododendron molle TaxID=49168 RepID=A0ACC0N7V3_RHOML|nr:hypothetical protein RHMOL_Rhmol07G0292900 [Rhododendron molle]
MLEALAVLNALRWTYMKYSRLEVLKDVIKRFQFVAVTKVSRDVRAAHILAKSVMR